MVISPTDEDDLLYNAAAVFQHVTVQTSPAIPASVLLRTHGIAIFPGMVLDGARFAGKGVMSARGATPTEWTPPVQSWWRVSFPFNSRARMLI